MMWRRARTDKEQTEGRGSKRPSRNSPYQRPLVSLSGGLSVLSVPGRIHGRPIGSLRIQPERIRENADRAAGCPNVFDLARREPVVDGLAADVRQFTCFHDRSCFSFHRYRLPTVRIGGTEMRV